LSEVPNASTPLKINSFTMRKDGVMLLVRGHLKYKK
jgi:hypothetical protein